MAFCSRVFSIVNFVIYNCRIQDSFFSDIVGTLNQKTKENFNNSIMSLILRKKSWRDFFHGASTLSRKIWEYTGSKFKEDNGTGRGKYMVFKGSLENFKKNGAMALEESISLFHGKANPIICFSVDELNTMNLEPHTISFKELDVNWYKGYWDGRSVLVKEQSEKYHPDLTSGTIREILVAAQMSTHNNVHKLLGCCIETKYTVLVFEWVQNVTLSDLVLRHKNQDKTLLDWSDRLRIAWEISHALAYLHTGFHQPIIHRSLKPRNVFLGIDNEALLSDFSLCFPLPKGKNYVHEDLIVGTPGYFAPEYGLSGKVSERIDVYVFGLLFLVLLTGKDILEDSDSENHLLNSVREDYLANKCIAEILDPVIFGNGLSNKEVIKQQLKTSVELALRCTETEEKVRPTMVDVATQLKIMVRSTGANQVDLLVNNSKPTSPILSLS